MNKWAKYGIDTWWNILHLVKRGKELMIWYSWTSKTLGNNPGKTSALWLHLGVPWKEKCVGFRATVNWWMYDMVWYSMPLLFEHLVSLSSCYTVWKFAEPSGWSLMEGVGFVEVLQLSPLPTVLCFWTIGTTWPTAAAPVSTAFSTTGLYSLNLSQGKPSLL